MATNRKPTTFHPEHDLPGPAHYDFILLPHGYSYNKAILGAKRGDRIHFSDGPVRYIYNVSLIPMDTPYCRSLCRYRYGVPLSRVIEVWKNNALLLGYGKNAVSEDECIILFYGEEEYIPEI